MSKMNINLSPRNALSQVSFNRDNLRPGNRSHAPLNTINFIIRSYRPHLLLDPMGDYSIKEFKVASFIYEEYFTLKEKCNLARFYKLIQ